MTERDIEQRDRVRVETGVAPVDCYLDNNYPRRINGVGVLVILDEAVVWEQVEYPRFLSSILGYMSKPFYNIRIERTKKKANRIAERLRSSL